ncbi:hypothetical protein HDU81_009645 [Chytriomyces hyalinus]|nr:hypothetical protein HDU81_009645 [Chytriomyces hyalinus]
MTDAAPDTPTPTPPPPPIILPRNWPSNITFASDYIISPDLGIDALPPVSPAQQLKHKFPTLHPKPYAAPLAQIAKITDPKHPAYTQNGLFSLRDIPCNTHIVDYIGLVISADSAVVQVSDYVLDFGGGGTGCSILAQDGVTEIRLAVDGQMIGNEGRMVNDARGVPCNAFEQFDRRSKKAVKKPQNPEFAHFASKSKPNVEFRSYVSSKNGEMRMGFFCCSPSGIRAGQELLISYGKGYWLSRGVDLEEMYQ